MQLLSQNIAKLGTIVGIWAHPDDESCWSAGLMAAARANGQRVVVVTATSGDGGKSADENSWPTAQLAEIREAELKSALEILGVEERFLLGYRDGKLSEVEQPLAVQQLSTILLEVSADTVLTFGADGITGHPDHQSVHTWALEAAKELKIANVYCATETAERYRDYGKSCDKAFDIYFNTESPAVIPVQEADMYFILDSDLAAKKFNAICAHQSQYAALLAHTVGRDWLHSLTQSQAFLKA